MIRHKLQNETVASRRALLRGIVSSASVLALGGSASIAATGARYDASSLAVEPTLLVATTRKPVNGGRTKPWFGPERATRMTVARVKLVAPDESRFSFAAAGLSDWRLDAVEPVSAEVGDLLGQGSGGADVLIYVHGFRQTFEARRSMRRVSPMASNSAARRCCSPGRRRRACSTTPMIAKARCGRAMSSSACFNSVATSPGAGRIHIVAHSMGTMLTLESLRQLYERYGDSIADKIGAVVFASPDIDMDVFSSAVIRIGPVGRKITVVTATNDRALALSGRIAGGMTRVGAAEKAAIERLGVRVIDASEAGWGIINHDLFLSNAEVRRVIRRSIDTSAA